MSIARAVLLATMLSIAPASAQTQDYPNRPITLVLPLAAGGSMDVIARGHFGPKLSERLGKPVIIENRTGGGTVIAATSVATMQEFVKSEIVRWGKVVEAAGIARSE